MNGNGEWAKRSDECLKMVYNEFYRQDVESEMESTSVNPILPAEGLEQLDPGRLDWSQETSKLRSMYDRLWAKYDALNSLNKQQMIKIKGLQDSVNRFSNTSTPKKFDTNSPLSTPSRVGRPSRADILKENQALQERVATLQKQLEDKEDEIKRYRYDLVETCAQVDVFKSQMSRIRTALGCGDKTDDSPEETCSLCVRTLENDHRTIEKLRDSLISADAHRQYAKVLQELHRMHNGYLRDIIHDKHIDNAILRLLDQDLLDMIGWNG